MRMAPDRSHIFEWAEFVDAEVAESVLVDERRKPSEHGRVEN